MDYSKRFSNTVMSVEQQEDGADDLRESIDVDVDAAAADAALEAAPRRRGARLHSNVNAGGGLCLRRIRVAPSLLLILGAITACLSTAAMAAAAETVDAAAIASPQRERYLVIFNVPQPSSADGANANAAAAASTPFTRAASAAAAAAKTKAARALAASAAAGEPPAAGDRAARLRAVAAVKEVVLGEVGAAVGGSVVAAPAAEPPSPPPPPQAAAPDPSFSPHQRRRRQLLQHHHKGTASASSPAAAGAGGGGTGGTGGVVLEIEDLEQLPIAIVTVGAGGGASGGSGDGGGVGDPFVSSAAASAALSALAAHPWVAAVAPDGVKQPALAKSLPLVRQPAAAAGGRLGAGCSVVVIDTGADWTHPDLGSCSAPGVGAGCRVSYAADMSSSPAGDDGERDDPSRHGTNVAATVAAVAPGASIIALDVFGAGGGAYDSDIIRALNWAVRSKQQRGICAVNLSLAGGVAWALPCSASPYEAALREARAAGIATAAAAGNGGAVGSLPAPACAPSAVSVGAVYDADFGRASWGVCADAATAADRVAW